MASIESSDQASAPESLSDVVSEDLTYPARDGAAIEAHLARPKGAGTYPAIIVLHARNGLQPSFKDAAKELAGSGFVGFALGWQTRVPPNPERTYPSDAVILDDIASASDYLRGQPFVDGQRIGIMGYCRGGTLTLQAASILDGLKAAVAHYGSPQGEPEAGSSPSPKGRVASAFQLADRLSCPLLMIHGDEDAAVPLDEVLTYCERLRAAGKDAAVEVYSGAGHAFTIRGGRSYQEGHAQDAWSKTVGFFRQQLGR